MYTYMGKKLNEHFIPPKTVSMARFEFYKRTQLPDENAHQFMVELQRLANDCQLVGLLDSMHNSSEG